MNLINISISVTRRVFMKTLADLNKRLHLIGWITIISSSIVTSLEIVFRILMIIIRKGGSNLNLY